jgi:hypothetical protein
MISILSNHRDIFEGLQDINERADVAHHHDDKVPNIELTDIDIHIINPFSRKNVFISWYKGHH